MLHRTVLLVCTTLLFAACGDSAVSTMPLVDATALADSASGGTDDAVEGADSSPGETGSEPEVCPDDHCDIDGECVSNGQAKADNPCLVCRWVVNQTEWTADDAQTCDDDDLCTVEDACVDGECTGEPACDDGNVCTSDTCEEATGECSTEPADGPCIDENALCAEAVCIGGNCTVTSDERECNDANPCTADTCDPDLGCVHTADNAAACDDGDACTANDQCNEAVCTGTAIDCDDASVCTADTCDPSIGCVNKPLDDACSDGNPCTDDTCDAVLGCVFPPNDDPCDDNTLCTEADKCTGGTCIGIALPIEDGNPCTTGSCDPAFGIIQTLNTLPCDDGNTCFSDDYCDGGSCQSGPTQLNCDDGNLCTDNSCEAETGCVATPNALNCEDGSVCTLNDACVNSSCVGDALNCDDENVCTVDTCDPVDGCVHTVIVSNACRPTINVIYPPRGATITGQSGSPSVNVYGSVSSDAGDIASFLINGQTVPIEADGSFNTDIPVTVGGNTLVMKATDELGSTRQRVQALLWSVDYMLPDTPTNDVVSPGLGIWFSQASIDDSDTSLPPNDLATVFKLVLDQFDIGALLGGGSGPIASQAGYKIYLNSLTYGGTDVNLQAVDGGLAIQAEINAIDGKLTFDCTSLSCFFLGGDSTGGLTVDAVTITANIALSATEEGALDVQLNDTNTSFSGIDIYSDNGFTNFLISLVETAIINGVVGDLQNELNNQLDSLIAPLLGDALGALAFNLSLDLPKPDGSGNIPISLFTDFEGADFQDADPGPQGGLLTQNAGAYTADGDPPYTNSGIPKRAGCGTGTQNLAVPKASPLELVLADDLLNHILYAAWRGGLLEFDVPASLLGDFDLSQFGISDLNMTLSGLLAPTASDCGEDGALLVHIGDVKINATLSLFGQPLSLVVWASFTAALELTAVDGAIGINISGIDSLDTEVNVEQDSLIGSESVIKQLIEEQLVGGLLDLLGGGAFGAIPLPEIDLSSTIGLAPGSAVISISPQAVSRVDGNSVVAATLGQ